jgi:hypothetical protein
MIQHEKYQWLYFNTQADDDSVGISTNACFRAQDMVGVFPTGNNEVTLAFKSMKNGNSAVTDTVALTLKDANTAKELMVELVQNINNTRPSHAGFLTVADDLTTIVGGSATLSPIYFSNLINACAAITLDTQTALNGTVTATDDGTGTGLVPGGGYYTVAADSDANHIVTLPAPTPGTVVWLDCSGDATGFEIRTTSPSTIKINSGSSSNGESAIAAAIGLVQCTCINATNWMLVAYTYDGGAIAAVAKAAD